MGEALVNILKGAGQTNSYHFGRAQDLDEDFSLAAVHAAVTHASTTAVNVTSEQSAIWQALEAFVFSQDLDIEQLRAA